MTKDAFLGVGVLGERRRGGGGGGGGVEGRGSLGFLVSWKRRKALK